MKANMKQAFKNKGIKVLAKMTIPFLLLGHATVMAEEVVVNSSKESQIAQQSATQVPGSPWLSSRLLVPHLTVVDVVESKKFYEDAFGFNVRFEDKPGADSQHVEMDYLGELVLMFVPQNVRGSGTQAPIDFVDPKQLTSYFYLYVDDVDQAFANAIDAGGIAITTSYDSAWGDRFAIIADPNGYHWGLAASPKLTIENPSQP